jgi:hypothetical protein
MAREIVHQMEIVLVELWLCQCLKTLSSLVLTPPDSSKAPVKNHLATRGRCQYEALSLSSKVHEEKELHCQIDK